MRSVGGGVSAEKHCRRVEHEKENVVGGSESVHKLSKKLSDRMLHHAPLGGLLKDRKNADEVIIVAGHTGGSGNRKFDSSLQFCGRHQLNDEEKDGGTVSPVGTANSTPRGSAGKRMRSPLRSPRATPNLRKEKEKEKEKETHTRKTSILGRSTEDEEREGKSDSLKTQQGPPEEDNSVSKTYQQIDISSTPTTATLSADKTKRYSKTAEKYEVFSERFGKFSEKIFKSTSTDNSAASPPPPPPAPPQVGGSTGSSETTGFFRNSERFLENLEKNFDKMFEKNENRSRQNSMKKMWSLTAGVTSRKKSEPPPPVAAATTTEVEVLRNETSPRGESFKLTKPEKSELLSENFVENYERESERSECSSSSSSRIPYSESISDKNTNNLISTDSIIILPPPAAEPIEMTNEDLDRIITIQRYFRKSYWEMELEKRVDFQTQRKHIFFEIVDTEETYVTGLTSLIEDIYEPIENRISSDDPILECSIFKNLFPLGHIKIIWNAHKNFIEELRTKKKQWSTHQTVGEVFKKMCAFLRLYTHYAESYSQVEEALENIRKEKKFIHFLQEQSSIEPVTYLSSLLITPIQRIPRYQLLLDSLLKKTWKSHLDYDLIENALSEMIETAKHVNFKVKEAENNRKLLKIDKILLGMKGKVSDTIVAANRKFIKEGFLFQRNEKGEWKKRMFFLLSDVFIRARPNKKQKGTYIFIEKVTLKKLEVSALKMDVKPLLPKEMQNRCFEINHPHPIRYVLCASTVEEKKEWRKEIKKLLTNLHEFEAKHEEAIKQISVKKAQMAKNLISHRFMQQTNHYGTIAGTRDLESEIEKSTLLDASSIPAKSHTVDPSTIRTFSTQMALAKMTTQQRWENSKLLEQEVLIWERSMKDKKADKKKQLLKKGRRRDEEEEEEENVLKARQEETAPEGKRC